MRISEKGEEWVPKGAPSNQDQINKTKQQNKRATETKKKDPPPPPKKITQKKKQTFFTKKKKPPKNPTPSNLFQTSYINARSERRFLKESSISFQSILSTFDGLPPLFHTHKRTKPPPGGGEGLMIPSKGGVWGGERRGSWQRVKEE